jgi:hypothetical protein
VIIELGVCQDQSRQINDLPGGRGFGEGQADVERTLSELTEVRKTLLGLLRSWPSRRQGPATVCPHIEHFQRLEVTEGGEEQWIRA